MLPFGDTAPFEGIEKGDILGNIEFFVITANRVKILAPAENDSRVHTRQPKHREHHKISRYQTNGASFQEHTGRSRHDMLIEHGLVDLVKSLGMQSGISINEAQYI